MGIRKTTLIRQVFCSLFGLSALAFAAVGVQPPAVPNNLKVPDCHTVLLKAQGQGVQIYTCGAKAGDRNQFEWVFKAPEADLVGDKGKKIGRHYAGPTWEANDGSKVVGEVQQRADAPRPGAVPWLLLKAKSNQPAGTFKSVTYQGHLLFLCSNISTRRMSRELTSLGDDRRCEQFEPGSEVRESQGPSGRCSSP